MMAALIHVPAELVDNTWQGREVIVGPDQHGVTRQGAVLEVEQHPTAHRTVFTLATRNGVEPGVDVREDTPVTYDGLGLLRGGDVL